MPEKLDPNTMDTITVVLSGLPEELNGDLAEYYAITFCRDEYLFLQVDELLQDGAQSAADRLVAKVDRALQRGELTRTVPMRVNIVLYEILCGAAVERIGQLRGIVSLLGGQLGILKPFVCLLKQQISGQENAGAMDRCAEACMAGGPASENAEGTLLIPILFVNRGIGITIDLPLKATVRYLHIISRGSILKSKLNGKAELITSIAMLEYDDEDSSTLQQQITGLQNELKAGGSAKAQLTEAVQAQIDEASRRFSGKEMLRLSQFPVRSDAIGNPFTVLFCRKRLNRALEDVSQTLAITYAKSVHERYCVGCLSEGESGESLRQLLESFPAPYIRAGISEDLDRYSHGKSMLKVYDAYTPRLRICLGEKRLRLQIEDQYRRLLERSRAYMGQVVIREMQRAIAAYQESGRIEEREKEINDRILRLKAKARAVGNAQSAEDFLKTQLVYLTTQGGVTFSNCTSNDMIMLVSKRMDEQWNQYEPYLPGSLNFEVYNYGALEDQEFQAMQIMRFDLERYRQNRGLIFQVN